MERRKEVGEIEAAWEESANQAIWLEWLGVCWCHIVRQKNRCPPTGVLQTPGSIRSFIYTFIWSNHLFHIEGDKRIFLDSYSKLLDFESSIPLIGDSVFWILPLSQTVMFLKDSAWECQLRNCPEVSQFLVWLLSVTFQRLHPCHPCGSQAKLSGPGFAAAAWAEFLPPAANGLGRLWVCYDVYLNNDSSDLWKSKRLSELLLLVLLQKSEERDGISLEKRGLCQEDGQRWWGRALQQVKSQTFLYSAVCKVM